MGKSEEILKKLREEFTFIGVEEIKGITALKIIEESFDSVLNSQSPNASLMVNFEYRDGEQVDTLQEGDWFIGTEEQYRKVLKMWNGMPLNIDIWMLQCRIHDHLCFYRDGLIVDKQRLKNKITYAEFLRRFENTIKD